MNKFRDLPRKFAIKGKLWEWARSTLITGGAQAAVQILAFASGIVILRMLPDEEYAYYTIAMAIMGSMGVLADSGLTSAVLAQGGVRWKSAEELGVVIRTGLELRRRLGILVAVVAAPLLIVLLVRQGCREWEATALALAILPAFFANQRSQMLEIVPRLHQQILPMQRIQVIGNAARGVLTPLSIVFMPYAAIACVVGAIPLVWTNHRLAKVAAQNANLDALPRAQMRSLLLKQVWRAAPGAVYFAFSGQLTVWLLSTLGDAAGIATVGALGLSLIHI